MRMATATIAGVVMPMMVMCLGLHVHKGLPQSGPAAPCQPDPDHANRTIADRGKEIIGQAHQRPWRTCPQLPQRARQRVLRVMLGGGGPNGKTVKAPACPKKYKGQPKQGPQ
jgi:hypothetical protein